MFNPSAFLKVCNLLPVVCVCLREVCVTSLLGYVGTVAEGAPIIPISAQLKYNIEVVCEYIVKKIPVPIRDFTSEPRLIGKNRHVMTCTSLSYVLWMCVNVV